MQLLSLTLPMLEQNLALDEALLLEAESGAGGSVLRLWEWPRLAVVLGAACSVAGDVCEENCTADGVPIGRRASGGGTVLLGPGCLLFSLILPYSVAHELTQINASYAWILGRLRDGLPPLPERVEFAGTSDLALGGRKFSGNSQQRKRAHVLHHGTLLYDFDLDVVGYYLRQPERQPDYRQDRDHCAFLVNLPLPRDVLEQALLTTWAASEELGDWPEETVKRLVEEKYARADWVRRR